MKKLVLTVAAIAATASTPAEAHGLRPHRGAGTAAAAVAVAAAAAAIAASSYGYGPYYYGPPVVVVPAFAY